VPGFVDIHVHGGGGADFMDARQDAARQIARTHARFGTTTLLATTLTGTNDQISRCIDAVSQVMNDPGPDEAEIAGFHLEGPYICAAKRGAQPFAPIRPPDWHEMQGWIARSGNRIRVITMAPEIGEALEFIGKAASAGIIVSLGHTLASFEQSVAALDTGASHATHLFNAMPPLGHRAPGTAGALLVDDRATVEIIADGEHVHPAAVRLAVRAKGADRVILITDAMSGSAMPDGDYSLGGQVVRVHNGAAKFDDGTLAGSVLTMNRAFTNVQRFAGISAAEASRMASTNPALSIAQPARFGRIEEGMRADLAVIHPETGAVAATMRSGKWIWRA
jgi:N-acetylglucosamine-6-phosphate deacetylase